MVKLEDVQKAFEGKEVKGKYWALLLFNTELELGISNTPNKWVNTGVAYYNSGVSALNAYSNTPNPASQLVDAKSPEELYYEIEKMIVNYSDENWLKENLYPYL